MGLGDFVILKENAGIEVCPQAQPCTRARAPCSRWDPLTPSGALMHCVPTHAFPIAVPKKCLQVAATFATDKPRANTATKDKSWTQTVRVSSPEGGWGPRTRNVDGRAGVERGRLFYEAQACKRWRALAKLPAESAVP